MVREMPEYIIKRDGRRVPFDIGKISWAIERALRATREPCAYSPHELAEEVVSRAVKGLSDGQLPTVEGIQDVVEQVLIDRSLSKTAKAYILYRKQHADMRRMRELLDGAAIIESYLDRIDWAVKENSNMGYSLQGLNNYIVSKVVSNYWLDKIYPQEVADAHRSGDFHLHDLGLLSVYCCGWDLKDLLIKGFRGAPQKVESRPARHFKTALGQVVNFFFTLQGESAGAQAFSHFDTLLAPFIRYDGLDYRQVRQAIQEFIFNLNIPTRVGFQTPFTNLTFDLKAPASMADEAVIYGGEAMNDCYGDFQKEMDMLNMAFCEVMMEGDASGRIFTFPIPTYNITRDFPWESKVVEKLFEMTAKYGVPYFSNFINSDMDPDDARSMCCRLRLDNRELKKRGGGLFGADPLTGSLGVVTINMPRLGILSGDEDEFFDRLGRLMELAKVSLEIKRKVLERFTEAGLFPYSKFYLRGMKRSTGTYWGNHFSTIGLVGMHESIVNMFGYGIDTPEGRSFALKTLDFMRDELQKFQEETGNLYNLEATPAEGASYRLALLDKERFPGRFEREEVPFYTNSTHLPVSATDDVFWALEHQEPLQEKYTGGTVFHVYLGEAMVDARACARFVKAVAENYRLPYFTITPTFSICPVHGYIPGAHETCPYEV